MKRRLFALLTAMALLLCAGCAGGNENSQPSSVPGESAPVVSSGPQTFSIAYSREDTLNPFAAATEVNLSLAGLLYDSLTVINDRFMPVNSLASGVEQTDATHLVAALRQGAVFSDGTAVTAQDVVSSFQQAKASVHYRALLSNVTAAAADRKTGAIVFTLGSADPHAAACLSFPVVKTSTLTTAAGQAPLGGGLYVLQTEEDGAYLQANSHSGKKMRYETVGLRHLPNSESMYYGLSSGNITYYYNDLNNGEIPRVTGASATVVMNDLLYLGVNSGRAGLNNAAVRQALSLLIDRKTLAASACSGWATAAVTPFHPVWEAGKELADQKLVSQTQERDLTAAVNLLEGAGYGTGAGQQHLKLELLYSSDDGSRGGAADRVRAELEGAGVEVTVTPLSYKEYQSRLAAGQYDLYLGEIRLAANMDLSPLLYSGGKASYGVQKDGVGASAYRQYREGAISLAEFTAAFAEDLPYIPLCWRHGFAAYDRRMAVVTPHGYNAYYGMENWK